MRFHLKHAGDETGARPAIGAALQHHLDDDQVRRVYRFMYRHVGNREDAEELTTRACERAMRTLRAASQDASGRQEQQSVEHLLCQAARGVIAEHLRWLYHSAPHARASDMSDIDVAWTEATVIQHGEQGQHGDSSERVRRILAQLPAQERDLLAQRFLASASLGETAATLRMSIGDTLVLQWSALADAAQVAARLAANETTATPMPCCAGAGS